MSLNRIGLVLVLLGMVAGLSSCKTPSAGLTLESYQGTKITVNSKLVADRLTVTEYNARKLNDLLQAQITVQNTTQTGCQFEYRFEWHDKDGMVVETPMTTWLPLSISAKEKKSLKAIAPAREVDDFVFIIRFHRPSTRW